MDLEKISVIVPVYNVEKYIERCVRSIISNSYRNLEIILVDDGSTDDSLSIMKSFEDERIVILEKKNGGVSSARNEAMKIATGALIAFVDADDWVHFQCFELLYQAMGEAQIAHCDMVRCLGYDESATIERMQEENKRMISKHQALRALGVKDYVWGKLYRRELLQDIYFPDNVKMCEDKVFLSEVLDNTNEVSVIDNKLYFYFNRFDSAVHVQGINQLPSAMAHLEVYKKRKNSKMLENAFLALFAHRYLNMFKPADQQNRREVNAYLSECKKLSLEAFPLMKRIVYIFLADFPIAYRIYRIMTDPTMLQWERNERKQ